MFLRLIALVIASGLVSYLIGRLTNFQTWRFLRLFCAMEVPLFVAMASAAVWWNMVSPGPSCVFCFSVCSIAGGVAMGLARADDPVVRAYYEYRRMY